MEQRASRAVGGARSGGGARHASWPEEADDGAEAGEGLAPRSAAAQAAAAAELQQLRVEDLGSTNGTYVNGQKLSGAVPLKRGDHVRIGGTVLEVDA